jgi:transcriptional regulator with XRE-family HTH domain
MFEVGERIKKLRLSQEHTRRQFASYIKISEDTLYQIEIGEQFPSLNTLIRIALIFNVTTDYLCGVTDEHGVRI